MQYKQGEMQKEILNLNEKMAQLQTEKKSELSSQFPQGYQIFGIENGQIFLATKPFMDGIRIDWATAKIVNVTPDFVNILLPDVVFPNHTVLEHNSIIIDNRVGATS